MTAASDFREAISAAVSRVDVVQISPGVARRLVDWLGEFADFKRRCNGCPPIGLIEVQQALAEACADASDSLCLREDFTPGDAEILALGHDAVIDTETAADMLGITPSGVTYLCRQGRLDAQKRAGRWFPTIAAVQERTANRSA